MKQSEPEETPEDERRSSPLSVEVLRGAGDRYGQTLDKTLRSAVVPYGYTVTIWSSGAYLISLRGVPSAWEAFAFVAGAIAAFGALSALSPRGQGSGSQTIAPPIHPDSSHPIFAAGLHVAAVGLAFGAATLVDRALGQGAWFFGSFVVTFIYLGIASAELAISVELHQRDLRLPRARALVGRPRAAVRRAVRRR